MTPKQALESLLRKTNQLRRDEFISEEIKTLEKALKALEIIKKIPADYFKILSDFLESFPSDNFDDFIGWCGDETPILITEEEYNLLKETLQ